MLWEVGEVAVNQLTTAEENQVSQAPSDDGRGAPLTANEAWVMPRWKEMQPVSQEANGPNTSKYFRESKKEGEAWKDEVTLQRGEHSRDFGFLQLVEYPLNTEIIDGISHGSEQTELKTATKQRCTLTLTSDWEKGEKFKLCGTQMSARLPTNAGMITAAGELVLPFSWVTVIGKKIYIFGFLEPWLIDQPLWTNVVVVEVPVW